MMMQYIRKNDYEAVHLDEEWIILNTDNYTVTRLNETGGFYWSLLREAHSTASLLKVILDRYECVSETAQQDLEVFLSDLIRCGLVEHAS
jgi:hypothetical protein